MSRLNRSDANQSVAAGEEEARDVREGGGGGMFTTLLWSNDRPMVRASVGKLVILRNRINKRI